jgi:predicted CXXCH cytochrome family protein
VHRGSESCRACHLAQYQKWSEGVHYKKAKCEVCHGAAGEHPKHPEKLAMPADSIKLCTLCHQKITGRPSTQPQIVVDQHPFPHKEAIQCIKCHNPHSPKLGGPAKKVVAQVSGPAAAGGVPSIDALTARCSGCHGANGEGQGDMFPRLAGKKADFLAQRLRSFRSGRVKSMMNQIAAPLNDAEIALLAKHYSKLTP